MSVKPRFHGHFKPVWKPLQFARVNSLNRFRIHFIKTTLRRWFVNRFRLKRFTNRFRLKRFTNRFKVSM